ncbi:exporter of polyketide antibiotics [soil metagenome]
MLRILLQQARRDRITLPIWILGTVFLLTVSASSVLSEYGDAAGRTKILQVALATPALLALRGIPNGASIGSAVHFQSFAFLALTIGLMNTFLASRHGRADEEKGRRELVLAAPVSRLTPLAATLVLGLVANSLFGVLSAFGYIAVGLDPAGAALSAAALALTGLAFLGIGMLAGELTATSRAANGIGAVAVLAAYAFRAAGDALGTGDLTNLTLQPAWPSWLSVIGWGQQTRAFTDDDWAPTVLISGLALVTIASAFAVHARRDLGASLLPERSGRAVGRPTLRSPVVLAWRLQWPTLLAWTVGAALLGATLGALVTAVVGVSSDNPQILAVLASLGHSDASDIATSLISALMVLVGVLAAAAGVQAVLRLREEEADGRLEGVLAAPSSRWRWIAAFVASGIASVVVVLLVSGLAAAASFWALGDADSAWLSLGQGLVQAPADLVFGGVAALLVGLVPRAALGVGWGVFALGVGVGLFGGLANLPDGVVDLSPISHVPALPTDDWVPTVVVGLIAVVLGVLAAIAFRRRDLST